MKSILDKPIVLASASPRRSELLKKARIAFVVYTSNAEEVKNQNNSVEMLCKLNAKRKASWVAQKFPDRLVIGADTLVTMDGKIYGKPHDKEDAIKNLLELQGRVHSVITGVALLCENLCFESLFHVETKVLFKELSIDQIQCYYEKVNPLDKAGGYAIQEYGEMIIDHIDGSLSNVIGLPIEELKMQIKSIKNSLEKNNNRDNIL